MSKQQTFYVDIDPRDALVLERRAQLSLQWSLNKYLRGLAIAEANNWIGPTDGTAQTLAVCEKHIKLLLRELEIETGR